MAAVCVCVCVCDARLQLQGELEFFDLAQQRNSSNLPGGHKLLGEDLKAPIGETEIWRSGDRGGLEAMDVLGLWISSGPGGLEVLLVLRFGALSRFGSHRQLVEPSHSAGKTRKEQE